MINSTERTAGSLYPHQYKPMVKGAEYKVGGIDLKNDRPGVIDLTYAMLMVSNQININGDLSMIVWRLSREGIRFKRSKLRLDRW